MDNFDYKIATLTSVSDTSSVSDYIKDKDNSKKIFGKIIVCEDSKTHEYSEAITGIKIPYEKIPVEDFQSYQIRENIDSAYRLEFINGANYNSVKKYFEEKNNDEFKNSLYDFIEQANHRYTEYSSKPLNRILRMFK